MLEQRIQQYFIDGADAQYQAAQVLAAPMAVAAQALLLCLTNGAKLLVCGSGASAVQAHQMAAWCTGGFERQRPGLAALALSELGAWISSTPGGEPPEEALAQQVRALGQAGDMLLTLSVSGEETAILAAVTAAHERDMHVVALTGRDGGTLAALLRETDVLLAVPQERAARVREIHALVLHSLCDSLDALLLGEQEMLE